MNGAEQEYPDEPPEPPEYLCHGGKSLGSIRPPPPERAM
jgi:hypothetical protein